MHPITEEGSKTVNWTDDTSVGEDSITAPQQAWCMYCSSFSHQVEGAVRMQAIFEENFLCIEKQHFYASKEK